MGNAQADQVIKSEPELIDALAVYRPSDRNTLVIMAPIHIQFANH